MINYLILVTIKDRELFDRYLKGHLPGLEQAGGRIVFRSTSNAPVLNSVPPDVVVIQEWPSEEAFKLWWHSDAYRPWAEIRDRAATMSIIACTPSLVLPWT